MSTESWRWLFSGKTDDRAKYLLIQPCPSLVRQDKVPIPWRQQELRNSKEHSPCSLPMALSPELWVFPPCAEALLCQLPAPDTTQHPGVPLPAHSCCYPSCNPSVLQVLNCFMHITNLIQPDVQDQSHSPSLCVLSKAKIKFGGRYGNCSIFLQWNSDCRSDRFSPFPSRSCA